VAHGILAMLIGVAGFLAMGHLVMQLGVLPPAPHWFRDVAPVVVEKGLLAPVAYLLVICLVGGAAAAVLAVPQGLHRSLVALVATFAAVFLLAWPTLMGPLDRATTALEFARQVRRQVPADRPLFSFVGVNNMLVYQVQRPLVVLASPAAVRDQVGSGRPFYLVCDERHLEALAPVAGLERVIHVPAPYQPREGYWLFRNASVTGG
jgi:hypothetical protein